MDSNFLSPKIDFFFVSKFEKKLSLPFATCEMSGRQMYAMSKTDPSQPSARSHKKPSPADRKHIQNDKMHRLRLLDFNLQPSSTASTAKFEQYKSPLLSDMSLLSITLPEQRIQKAYDTETYEPRLRLPAIMTFGSMQKTEANIMWAGMDTNNNTLLSGQDNMTMRLLVNPQLPKSLEPIYFSNKLRNFKFDATSLTEIHLHDTELYCTLMITHCKVFCVEHDLNNFTTHHVQLTKGLCGHVSVTPKIVQELSQTKLNMLNHSCHHLYSRRIEKKPVRDKAIDYLCEQNIEWQSSSNCMNASFPSDIQFIGNKTSERTILRSMYRDIVAKHNMTMADRKWAAEKAEAEAGRLRIEEANAMMIAPCGDIAGGFVQGSNFIEDELDLDLETWDELQAGSSSIDSADLLSMAHLPFFDDEAYI